MGIEELVVTVIVAFVRIASFLFFLPMMGGRFIPVVTKLSLALALSFIAIEKMEPVVVHTATEFVLLLLIQFFIGATLAFIVEVVFSAIRMAGGMLDMDMGFSASQIVDPANGTPITVISNIFFLLFMSVFISVGGLNALMTGILQSFAFTTPGFFIGDHSFIEMILGVILYMFTAAVQIALPLVATMFIINFIMLIIGKSAPQMNIFANIFIIKIALGILLLYVALPFVGEIFMQMNEVMMEKFAEAMEVIFK